MTTPEAADAKKVLLAAPRGYCAGVDRAVETVERALEKYARRQPRCACRSEGVVAGNPRRYLPAGDQSSQ